jgi:broad specificity phosphatase PhoE
LVAEVKRRPSLRRRADHLDLAAGDLDALGRQQAETLAESFASESIDALYASDLSRARETAEILGAKLGLGVEVDPDLREKNWGNWEGLTSEERLHVAYAGETSEDHRVRTLRAVRRIVERHPGERIVVVTHGGSLRIYEIDYPATQRAKRTALASADITIPSNLSFVPIDFERDSLADALRTANFDFGRKTFCSWLGVTQYLSSAAIIGTLRFVLSLLRSSEIIFRCGAARSRASRPSAHSPHSVLS